MVEIKTCSKCKELKDETEFSKEQRNKNGLRSWCKSCYRKQSKQYNVKNRETRATYFKEYRRLNTEKIKEARFIKEYGLTYADRDGILQSQGSRCAICRIVFSENKKPQMDHCHVTNKVRGILCVSCNIGLGHLGDTTDSLKAAYEYLKRSEL